MANKKISDYPAAAALTSADLVELEQPGQAAGDRSRKATLSDLAAYFGAGGGAAATPPLPKTVITEGVGASMEYKCEPVMVECPSGDILCVYRRASAHVSNDGKLVMKKSTDKGATWGAESDVYDTAFDTRNQAIGINPSTGRIFLFLRVLNAPSTTVDIMVMYTDDEGATWSTPVSINSALPISNLVPFGPLVETSRGLTMAFYLTDQIATLRSTDNGATWDGAVTIINAPAQTADFNEPTLIALDDDRVVMLIRLDGLGKNGFCYAKSTDGGANFTISGEVEWNTATISTAAPIYAVKIDAGEVGLVWFARNATNRLYYTRISADAFWEDPSIGWATSGDARRTLATARRRFGSVTTATDLEFGYAFPLVFSGVSDRILVGWYDTGDGTNTNCSVYCMRTPAY